MPEQSEEQIAAMERAAIKETLSVLGVEDKDLKVIDGHLPLILKVHEYNRKLGDFLTNPRVSAQLVSDKIKDEYRKTGGKGIIHGVLTNRNGQRTQPSGKSNAGNGKRHGGSSNSEPRSKR
jgi:hypothetical protein